jgi:hypothetical protein
VQRTAPKAALQADPLLRYQYGLAREMGMTLKRLVAELGPGEIAYQIAYDELETNKHDACPQRCSGGNP